MNKTLLRSASLMLAIALTLGVFTPGQAISQTTALMPNKIVNVAYFYKPPTNSDAATVASSFSTVILTGGDEIFRDQLLANGFSSTISQYFRAEGIQDPGSCTATPARNQIGYKAGDFCNISNNNPDWFLLDTMGNRMRTSPTSSYYRMDPGNAGWRNFFVTRLVEMSQQKGWNGVFLDNLEASLSEIQRDGITPAKYPDNASYTTAVRGFIQYLDQYYSKVYNRPVSANIIARTDEAGWFNYMPYLSGAMQERWAVAWSTTSYVSESKWISDLVLAEKTQAQGKYIILVAPGEKADTNRQKFAYASFLLVSNGKAAFRYANSSTYSEVWPYSNYSLDLGTPLGARYQSGTAWRRDFTNGYVVVDPISHAATISAVAGPTSTPTKAPTLAVTSTATKSPTTAVTSPATQVPTLAATTTPTKAPTLAVMNTATSVPTLAATSAPTQMATNTVAPAPTTTIYDTKNPAIVYSSGWKDVADALAYNGDYRRTQNIGSSATLTFTGQTFSIIYNTGPRFGHMAVYVDGVLVHTLNQETVTANFQQKWSYGGTLAPGSHTLKLIFASGPPSGRVSLDAVSIP